MKKILLFTILMLILSMNVSAITGVPAQFWGDVTVNGNPATDGTFVEARIDGDIYAVQATKNGKYGYDGNAQFLVGDPDGTFNGRTIEFYVADVKATEVIFNNLEPQQLDLSVSCPSCVPPDEPDDPPATGGRSGGGGGGGGAFLAYLDDENKTTDETSTDGEADETVEDEAENTVAEGTTETCTAEWKCSSWTACVNNARFRSCFDLNECGGEEIATQESCDQTTEELLVATGAATGGGTKGAVTIVSFAILLGIIVGMLVIWKLKK